ncbi:MAG: hypothetical protein V7607_4697, partial [Solirubrobacteraceae bacterium]
AGRAPARAAYRSPLGAPWRGIMLGLADSGAATRRRLQAQGQAALERALDRESPELEHLLVRVLDSRLAAELTDRVMRSPEMQQMIGHIASSPELRAAMSEQSAGLADEMVAGVRRRTASMDDVAERTVRGWLRRPRSTPS